MRACRRRSARLCEGVVIRVEDFPDDETLSEMGCETPFDLLGLFRGIGLAQGGAMMQTGQFPNMVWLYRRPILDYWAEHEETLGPHRHPRAGARDRPPFRPLRRGHGGDRGGGGIAHRAKKWTRLFADAALRVALNDALFKEWSIGSDPRSGVHFWVRCFKTHRRAKRCDGERRTRCARCDESRSHSISNLRIAFSTIRSPDGETKPKASS